MYSHGSDNFIYVCRTENIKNGQNEILLTNMNTIGTVSGYRYRHTERERFKINTYGFQYWNNKCLSIDMSKGHDYLFENNMFIRKVKSYQYLRHIFDH